MNVNFSNIKTGAINGLNSIGTAAYDVGNRALGYAQVAKDTVLKNDKFVSLKNKLSSQGVEKKTVLGGAVLLCALGLALKCVKGMVNKVKEIRTK